MSYTLRFESSAFQADSSMQRLLDVATGLGNRLQKFAGIKIRNTDDVPLKKLYGINARIFEATMDWADQDFDEQMMEEQWDWKGPEGRTRRKNGETVYEPRNIVDMGVLIKSKQRTPMGRSSEEFRWVAEHAQGVHDGYTARGGSLNPARPWTEYTLQDIDGMVQSIGDSLRR